MDNINKEMIAGALMGASSSPLQELQMERDRALIN
jgi:hypothetical protein